jgi:hypothetical protein
MWKMIKRKIEYYEGLWVFLLLVPFFIAMIIVTVTDDSEHNTDPKKGIVWIGSISKRCDGTTLIYNGDGTQLVMNSPECM